MADAACRTCTHASSSYLLLPTGRIDPSQTGSVQESALVEADADEVCSTVGRRAHQNTTIGQKVVNLGGRGEGGVQVTSRGRWGEIKGLSTPKSKR